MRKRPSRQIPREPARQDDFLRRAFADVTPLEKGRRRAPPPEPAPARSVRVPAPLDTTHGLPEKARFVLERNDEYVSGYREELGPNALRAMSSRDWRPDEVLDLHGHRVRGLEQELAREFRSFARRGLRRVLLIHGKGLHSTGGMGVLAQAVVDALTDGDAARFVRALKTAAPRLGGSGALAVELEIIRRHSR